MEWQKVACLVAWAAVLCRYVPMYIQTFGVLEDVYNHLPGPCEFVPGIDEGAENIEMLENGKLMFTSGLERFYNRSKSVRGRIYTYDLDAPKKAPVPVKVSGVDEDEFIPHGLSIFRNSSTGALTVFVANHHSEGDRVEKFRYVEKDNELKYIDSFSDNRMTQANDMVALSEDSFYFTNYLFNVRPFFQSLEIYLLLPWGSVFYFEKGKRPELVAGRLKQPNGIVMSEDGRYVYVGNEGYQEVLVYRRHSDNSLKLVNTYQVNSPVDNLSLSPDGSTLWLAGHAVHWKIMKQLEDPQFPVPSQVLKLHLKGGSDVTKVTEILADDGTMLRGSSAAVYHNHKLLVGTSLHKLMLCDLSNHSDKK